MKRKRDLSQRFDIESIIIMNLELRSIQVAVSRALNIKYVNADYFKTEKFKQFYTSLDDEDKLFFCQLIALKKGREIQEHLNNLMG